MSNKEKASKIYASVPKEIQYTENYNEDKIFYKNNFGKIVESNVQFEFE